MASFSKFIRWGACYASLVALAAAASFEVNLSYASLPLKNGRTLTDVKIKSFDFDTGKVILLSGRNLSSLQIEMLPDDIAAKIAALVPEESKAQAREEKARREQALLAESKSRQDREEKSQADAARSTAAQAQRTQEQDKARAQERLMAGAKKLAYIKANHYFRYEYNPGSGSTISIRQGIVLSEPEPVPGWPGRVRLTGQVGLQYYDSRGRSFNTANREFEVIVQQDSKGREEVVDFTLR